jgi:hypothetical protein
VSLFLPATNPLSGILLDEVASGGAERIGGPRASLDAMTLLSEQVRGTRITALRDLMARHRHQSARRRKRQVAADHRLCRWLLVSEVDTAQHEARGTAIRAPVAKPGQAASGSSRRAIEGRAFLTAVAVNVVAKLAPIR